GRRRGGGRGPGRPTGGGDGRGNRPVGSSQKYDSQILVPFPSGAGPRRVRPPRAGGPSRMKTVTKKELVHRIAGKTGFTKVVAKDVIQSFLDAIISELAEGNRLEFREFGVFETKERAARRAQNPRTL